MDSKTKPRTSESAGDDNSLVVNSRIRIPLSEFQFTYTRSSGPGGQNVNKLNTKAQLRWNVTESPSVGGDLKERFVQKYRRRVTSEGDVLIVSQRFRDQSHNAADCLEKLREMLAEASHKPTPRKKTKPSRGARERRLREKKVRSERKQSRRMSRDL
jgi:ribosome-associated protein